MGKQINYYMGFKDFIKVAQFALDLGCVICREENKKIICSDQINIVTPSVKRYFFYLPEAGDLRVRTENGREEIGGYNASGNVLIEAGFSYVKHDRKTITRGRLFSITGYYDESGNWMERPECVKKAYDKIARKVKKQLLLRKLQRSLQIIPQMITGRRNGSIKNIFRRNCLN